MFKHILQISFNEVVTVLYFLYFSFIPLCKICSESQLNILSCKQSLKNRKSWIHFSLKTYCQVCVVNSDWKQNCTLNSGLGTGTESQCQAASGERETMSTFQLRDPSSKQANL